MPMRFDSFETVEPVAQYLGLRGPLNNETLEEYRCFVADHDKDILEAMELRTGRPWDEFTSEDRQGLLKT